MSYVIRARVKQGHEKDEDVLEMLHTLDQNELHVSIEEAKEAISLCNSYMGEGVVTYQIIELIPGDVVDFLGETVETISTKSWTGGVLASLLQPMMNVFKGDRKNET